MGSDTDNNRRTPGRAERDWDTPLGAPETVSRPQNSRGLSRSGRSRVIPGMSQLPKGDPQVDRTSIRGTQTLSRGDEDTIQC